MYKDEHHYNQTLSGEGIAVSIILTIFKNQQKRCGAPLKGLTVWYLYHSFSHLFSRYQYIRETVQ